MKQIITKEEVGKAILDLAGQGKKPTLAAVHAALNNRGSIPTLASIRKWLEEAKLESLAGPVCMKLCME